MIKENPIDKDKITETPSTLPYAHHVGSPVIKPIDKGRVKGNAMSAMVEQTNKQMEQIHKQIQLLADQAKDLQKRVEISERIYLADMNFKPLIGHVYYLYQRDNLKHFLSMISPEEWGRSLKMEFISEVKLMHDHTWDVIRENINWDEE
jgi:hypothetical protein